MTSGEKEVVYFTLTAEFKGQTHTAKCGVEINRKFSMKINCHNALTQCKRDILEKLFEQDGNGETL